MSIVVWHCLFLSVVCCLLSVVAVVVVVVVVPAKLPSGSALGGNRDPISLFQNVPNPKSLDFGSVSSLFYA